MDSRVEEVLRISADCYERFRPYRNLCQDIAENFYPLRADFTRSLNMEEFAGNLMDGFTTNTRETLANAIDAMLRQGPWFSMGTGDEARDKRPGNMVSLSAGTKAFRSLIYRRGSGLPDALKEWDNDWVSFGAFSGSVEAAADYRGLVFKPHHMRDACWIDDDDGRVDTHYLKIQMTARDIVRKVESGRFNGELSPMVRIAARQNPGQKFTIQHVLMPTDDIYGGSIQDVRRVRHPFVSLYIDVDNRTLLHERGAPVFNKVVGRQRRLSGTPFGFSPMALNSLPDARMLQDMALVIIEQGQKALDPPTIGSASVFTRDMNFYAGGHTEVDLDEERRLQDVFTTVETGQVGVGLELKQDVRALITEAWLLNKLTLPTLRDMRELEVQVRTDEFRRAALPFFQPIEPSYHGEVLGCAYQMATTLNLVDPNMFAQELRDQEMQFTYASPLNEAEGLDIVRKYYEAVNIVSVGANIDKTVANIFDLRGATEDAISLGAKPEWLIPEDQRQQADQQADAVSGLTQAAQIAREAAGVTADTANASMAAQQAGLAPAA